MNNPQPGLEINSVTGKAGLSELLYTGCEYSTYLGHDAKSIVTISGNDVNIKNYDYASSDGTCSAGESFLYETTTRWSIDGNVQTSWLNSIVPTRQDNGQPLPDPATATKLTVTITAIVPGTSTPSNPVGYSFKDIWFIDDTTAVLSLYDGFDSLGDPAGGTNNGYPILLTAN